MIERQYYSERKNKSSKMKISFESLVEYFDGIHTIFFNKGHFHQVPSGSIAELNLLSIEIFNKEYILPFHKTKKYSEEDIFDLIEFFYDYIETPRTINSPVLKVIESKREKKAMPIKQEVQADYRNRINRVISKYDIGYELTEGGYIREIISNGLEELIDSPQVPLNDEDTNRRIRYAKETFFKHGATEEEKRSAILEVGAVIEKLRDSKQLNLTSKDAGDLFTVLNAFNIRHNRKDQKSDYDKEIFYPWMFYNLLAAIDASIKLQKLDLEH